MGYSIEEKPVRKQMKRIAAENEPPEFVTA
jgi:hypothetical protein